MTKVSCPNTTSDQNTYSAPVPFIGLYIEIATLVCFILMMCDVVNGIRRRKPWLPCKYFTLNSITLIILPIASKLPVDLSTSMPSADDQLSKLTGTAFICVSMGFLMPSLGTRRPSEGITNMIALTIMVIVVILNICVQMFTGVIFSFFDEHFIIMFCMIFWLLLLWSSTLEINMRKEIQMDHKKDRFTNSQGSLLRQLKLCYLHGYNSDPQFVLCKISKTIFASFPCLLCVFVVLRATFRSLITHKVKFCNGFSDYGWSIRIIVVTQIVAIILASLAIGCRRYVNFCDDHDSVLYTKFFDDLLFMRPLLKGDTLDCFDAYFRYATDIAYSVVTLGLLPLNCVLTAIWGFAEMIIGSCLCFVRKVIIESCLGCKLENKKSEGLQEYEDLLRENGMKLEKWTLKKCMTDIKRWISLNDKCNSPSHLRELVSRIAPSQHSLEKLYSLFYFNKGKQVSCLDLVFLVRIASLVSTPSTPCDHLTQSLSEVFDVVHFIDTTMNSLRPNNKKKCVLAKAMWKGEEFSIALSKSFKESMNKPCQSQSELDHAVEIIGELEKALPSLIRDEVGIIMDCITDNIKAKKFITIGELPGYIEHLFVYMVHILLSQFPYAICKELTESRVEEYEEKVRRMLKLQCQIKPLNGKVQWSFPVVGCNSAGLMEEEDHNVGDIHSVEVIQIE